ncbi:MAG TPA: CAP domain-containing protein, partial [Rubrobacteraceae bacterium]|nr:CAP domain-containing protein [Rubrobacteraceae bacterium]
MRLRYIWFIVVALAILFAGSISGERSVRAEESRYDPEEQKFLKLINDYRQSKGLTTLTLSDVLTVASERHSEDMGRH